MPAHPTGERSVLVVSAGGRPGRHSVQPALAAWAETQDPGQNRKLGRRSEQRTLVGRTAT
jgi:hypothetical protein